MSVKLLSHTPDAENIIAKAAKLCYSDSTISELIERVNSQETGAFIEKLIGMGHDSPLEHVSFNFGVEGISRVTSHQLVRHRIASYSQQSQRYVKLNKTFDYIIPESIQGNRPAFEEYTRLMEVVHKIYVALLDVDIPAEDARYILPNATETKIFITMNARTLLHFFQKRCCNRAQWEIRQMALEMLIEVKKVAPLLFHDAGPQCVAGTCGEGKMSCFKMGEVRDKYEALNEPEEVGTNLDVTG
ncbi:MAG: FAD-dependent thymidylate synthase [Methylococcaceae bacterium]